MFQNRQQGNVLCHVSATVDAYSSELDIVGAGFLYLDEIQPAEESVTRPGLIRWEGAILPWLHNGRTFFDFPLLEYAFYVGFESGGVGFLDLILITQIVPLCHRGLVDV